MPESCRPLLSKWWLTASAQAAIERSKQIRKTRLDEFLVKRRAEKQALDDAIWGNNKPLCEQRHERRA